jgi:hypothetical protein
MILFPLKRPAEKVPVYSFVLQQQPWRARTHRIAKSNRVLATIK